jgi:hypothetical protein
MTDTPIADDAQAAQELSIWGKIREDTARSWRIASRVFPIMEKIADNPAIDQLFEEALMGLGAGVAAEYFQAATDALRAARQRQQAGIAPAPLGAPPQPPAPPAPTGPQPQFTPADNATAQLPVSPGAA